MAKLKGSAYEAFLVDKKDQETKTSQVVHFKTGVNPVKIKIGSGESVVDLSQTNLPEITVFGSHLDSISKVVLTSKSQPADTDTIPVTKANAASLTFDLKSAAKIQAAANKAGPGAPLKVEVAFETSDPAAKPIPAPSDWDFEVKGKPPAPKPAPPAAPEGGKGGAAGAGTKQKPKPGTPTK